jgi:hypothetical protein
MYKYNDEKYIKMSRKHEKMVHTAHKRKRCEMKDKANKIQQTRKEGRSKTEHVCGMRIMGTQQEEKEMNGK